MGTWRLWTKTGRELQHEGDGGLQGPPRQADHGENSNPKFQRASSHEQKERDGWSKSGEDAVPEVGRRVSWVAPASTSNITGYPGDLKFPGRCDRFYPNFLQVGDQNLAFGLHFCDQDGGTPLESDLDQGAGEEASSPAGGARGDGGVVVGGV